MFAMLYFVVHTKVVTQGAKHYARFLALSMKAKIPIPNGHTCSLYRAHITSTHKPVPLTPLQFTPHKYLIQIP